MLYVYSILSTGMCVCMCIYTIYMYKSIEVDTEYPRYVISEVEEGVLGGMEGGGEDEGGRRGRGVWVEGGGGDGRGRRGWEGWGDNSDISLIASSLFL